MKLVGKTVLITGGGSGIGAATARRFAEHGAKVALAGRSAEPLQRVAEGIRKAGGTASVVVADVTSAPRVREMVDFAVGEHGSVDILVNNAGAASIGPVRSYPVEEWDRLMAVNVRGVFLCCQAVLPVMEQQRSGHIINVSSVAAKVSVPDWSAYIACKSAVAAFSRALQEEVRRDGIRVSVLYPAAVDTPLWDTFPNAFDKARMMTADDIADAIVYVASQPASVLVDEISLTPPGGLQ